jgi:hypothetical protein
LRLFKADLEKQFQEKSEKSLKIPKSKKLAALCLPNP